MPFDKARLAGIILKSVLPMWLNQYNLTHTTPPKSLRQLLLDLEAIEWVMNKKHIEKAKVKTKDTAALAYTGSNE